MKTMKARLNQIILVTFLTAFLVISGNVNAEGTEVLDVSGLEKIEESKLQIENWMVNETCWIKIEKASMIESEHDKILLLEAWMLDESKWNRQASNHFSTETEQELMLENWMISEMYWN